MSDQRREMARDGLKIEEEPLNEPRVSVMRLFSFGGKIVNSLMRRVPEADIPPDAEIINIPSGPALTLPGEQVMLSERGTWTAIRGGELIELPFAEVPKPEKVDTRPIPRLPEPAAEFAPTLRDRLVYDRAPNPVDRYQDIAVGLRTDLGQRKSEGLQRGRDGLPHFMDSL